MRTLATLPALRFERSASNFFEFAERSKYAESAVTESRYAKSLGQSPVPMASGNILAFSDEGNAHANTQRNIGNET